MFKCKPALLINGTQLTTALLTLTLAGAEELVRTADVATAMTVDALLGSVRPTDPRIHEARPHAGQAASARNIRRLSQILVDRHGSEVPADMAALEALPGVALGLDGADLRAASLARIDAR